MSDTVPTPASGGGFAQGKPDGVNAPADRGRTGGGESGGSSYTDQDNGSAHDPQASGFMGHGGQTDIAYHGGGQAGAEGERAGNGTTRTDGESAGDGEAGPKPGPRGPYQDRVAEQTRDETIAGRTVAVFEDSGVAAAEATGNTGAEGQRKLAGDQPGSG